MTEEPAGPATATRRLRVLLVDDSPALLDPLCDFLRRQPGCEIVGIGYDGQEAVEMSGALQPDLIIMDFSMPYLTGTQAAAALKQKPGAPRIILMSLNMSPCIRLALEAGHADGFCLKSDMPRDLMPLLRRLFPADLAGAGAGNATR